MLNHLDPDGSKLLSRFENLANLSEEDAHHPNQYEGPKAGMTADDVVVKNRK